MSTRPVPVPRTCQAMYVVLTPRPLGVDDTLPLPSAALLRHHGTSAAALERFESLRHQRVLHHRVPVERAVDAAVELRVEALRLAEEHDGVVVDLTVPRVLELGSHEVSAGAASQWYVLDAAAVLDGRLQTDGLVQFGLPELRIDDVGPGARAVGGAVVAGIVHRLVAEWPDHDPVGPAGITLRDIAHGLGDPQAKETPVKPVLAIDIAHDDRAQVLTATWQDDPAEVLFAGA
ncbi:hypothetical protein [Aeromicrobium halocynthiae]